jgi:hypothetical protein
MSSETLQKVTAFFSTVRASDAATAPSAPVLKSLDAELAKRGISLQLSGKVNNVYLSGENAHWAVNASAGGESESTTGSNRDKTAARSRRYNNFGQTLGRAAKNFILGH